MKKLLYIVAAFIVQCYCSNFSFAQNLVINPSFEDTVACPWMGDQIYYATGWFQPNTSSGNTTNSSSTDYFNECSNTNTNIPQNGWGYQYARTGKAYSGANMYTHGSCCGKEYIEGELITALESDKLYCVSFYVSRSDSAVYAISNIGLYFTPESLLQASPAWGNLNYASNIQNPINNIITDSERWIRISGKYLAVGGEKFFTIGNFTPSSSSNATKIGTTLNPNFQAWGYYYIDDVSVVLCDTDTIAPPPIDSFIEIPNIFTPDGDGLNELFYIENLPEKSRLQIFNRWDRLIFSTANYKNNWNASDVVGGVYYYFLTLPDGKLYKGFVHVIK